MAAAVNGNMSIADGNMSIADTVSLESLCAPARTQTVRTIDARLLEPTLRAIREERVSGTLTIQISHGSPCSVMRLEQYTP